MPHLIKGTRTGFLVPNCERGLLLWMLQSPSISIIIQKALQQCLLLGRVHPVILQFGVDILLGSSHIEISHDDDLTAEAEAFS